MKIKAGNVNIPKSTCHYLFFGRSVADNKTNHTASEELITLRSTVLRSALNDQKFDISQVKEYISSEYKLNIDITINILHVK